MMRRVVIVLRAIFSDIMPNKGRISRLVPLIIPNFSFFYLYITFLLLLDTNMSILGIPIPSDVIYGAKISGYKEVLSGIPCANLQKDEDILILYAFSGQSDSLETDSKSPPSNTSKDSFAQTGQQGSTQLTSPSPIDVSMPKHASTMLAKNTQSNTTNTITPMAHFNRVIYSIVLTTQRLLVLNRRCILSEIFLAHIVSARVMEPLPRENAYGVLLVQCSLVNQPMIYEIPNPEVADFFSKLLRVRHRRRYFLIILSYLFGSGGEYILLLWCPIPVLFLFHSLFSFLLLARFSFSLLFILSLLILVERHINPRHEIECSPSHRFRRLFANASGVLKVVEETILGLAYWRFSVLRCRSRGLICSHSRVFT